MIGLGRKTLAATGIAAMLSGCAPDAPQPTASDRACALQGEFHNTPIRASMPGVLETLRQSSLSEGAVRTAVAIGAVTPLSIVINAERHANRLDWFLIGRQGFSERALLALLEVQSSIAALECDSTRAGALASRLDNIQSNRTALLNAAGIAIGAVTNVASGVLALAAAESASSWATIAGGVAGGVAGGSAMMVTTTGHFLVSTRMLEDVYRQPEQSTAFPPRVWRFLMTPAHPGGQTPAQEVVAEWRSSGLIPADGDEDAVMAILRSQGRLQSSDLLNRRMLIDVLVSRIGQLSRNIRRMLDEVAGRPLPPSLAAGPHWLRAEAAGAARRARAAD